MKSYRVEFVQNFKAETPQKAVDNAMQYFVQSQGVACVVFGGDLPEDGIVVVGKMGCQARLCEDYMNDAMAWEPWKEENERKSQEEDPRPSGEE